MTTECDPKSTPKQSNSFSERLDAESRQFAQWLHEQGDIYALFGLADGLNISVGWVAYVIRLMYSDSDFSSTDKMHEWLMSPEGMAAVAVESILLVTFSTLANVFSDKDEDAYRYYIAVLWPYLRTIWKGLSHGQRAVFNTIKVFDMLSGQDLRKLILPIGLLLGVLSAVNRVCMRKYVEEPRKEMVKANANLLLKIQATKLYLLSGFPEEQADYNNSYILVDGQLYYIDGNATLERVYIESSNKLLFALNSIKTEEKEPIYLSNKQVRDIITLNGGHVPPASGLDAAACQAYHNQILGHSDNRRNMALIGAAYSGVIDGLYMFMGAMVLAPLSSPVFIAMAAFSVTYSMMCVVTRVFEESDFQRRLLATQAEIELALCGKELELLLTTLQRLSSPLITPMDESTRERLQKDSVDRLGAKAVEFDKKRELLRLQVTLTDSSIIFAGLRNGLTVYNGIMSVMFAIAAINAMLVMALPPVLLIVCISSGIVCLIACVAYALHQNKQFKLQQKKSEIEPTDQLTALLERLKKNINEARDLTPPRIRADVHDGMFVAESPEYDIQTLSEIWRLFFTGIAKGEKSVDFTLNHFQEADAQGHFHDTPVMFSLSVFSAAFYAAVYFLRGVARYLRKPDRVGVVGDDAVVGDIFPIPEQQQKSTTKPALNSSPDADLEIEDDASASEAGAIPSKSEGAVQKDMVHPTVQRSRSVPLGKGSPAQWGMFAVLPTTPPSPPTSRLRASSVGQFNATDVANEVYTTLGLN